MIGTDEEHWRELCKQASAEQDPKKMVGTDQGDQPAVGRKASAS